MKPMQTRGAMPHRFLTSLLALSTCLILAACGGGGGGGSSSSGGSSGGSTGGGTGTGTGTTPTPTATVAASASTVVAGQPVTLTWSSQNATSCTASGAWSGTLATSGTQVVTTTASASDYTDSFTITCGSASGTATVSVTAPTASHSVAMTIDNGPAAAGGSVNAPYVTVTVCRPGTSVCQTIDHILVDTGSFGLRLIEPVDSALALPAVQSASGVAIGECGQFVSGYTWGSLARADIKIGSEVASNLSIQLIGDSAGGVGAATNNVPNSCTSIGSDIGSVHALGANGVLGIGLFKQDCGTACVTRAVSATYYACANGSCSPTTMPLAQQVTNPVAAFAVDNNGVVLSFPAVSAGGASSLAGTLTFGIGTQSDNGLGSATKYTTDANGHITTVYRGTTLATSFIDTGSNGLFFNDASIAHCSLSTDFYCPASPLSLSATFIGNNGATTTVPFTIESVDALPNGATVGWIGGPSGSSAPGSTTFDWGLPFFFGRKVFIGLESDTAPPYWAF